MLHTLWSTITNFSLLLTSHLLKTHAPHPAHVLSSVKFTVMLSLVHRDSVSVRSFQMALCGQKVNRSQIKLLKYGLKVLEERKVYSHNFIQRIWGQVCEGQQTSLSHSVPLHPVRAHSAVSSSTVLNLQI